MKKVSDALINEYYWLENAASDYTVDSPFYSLFGQMIRLLSEEVARGDKARVHDAEIKISRIPKKGTKWVRLEARHPTENVVEIQLALESQAAEGIACGMIISLSNVIKDLNRSLDPQNPLKIKQVGAKCGERFWVDTVSACANYIRHGDEWKIRFEEKKPFSELQERSIKILEESGIDKIREGKVTYLELAKHLQLKEWRTFFRSFSSWILASLPDHPAHGVISMRE